MSSVQMLWEEREQLQDVVTSILADLNTQAKAAGEELKQGAPYVKGGRFKQWAQTSINKIAQASGMQPQEA